jgi:hypothetical protein
MDKNQKLITANKFSEGRENWNRALGNNREIKTAFKKKLRGY